MGIIGENSKNVVSRKDYLKNKRKQKYKKIKIVPILFILLILVLSAYVYKQLQVYNSITKIANDVVEQNALVTTQKIYYVGTSYTKNEDTNIMEYNVQDKSRKVVKNSQNIKNIQVDEKYIYGILDNKLYKINRNTYKKTKITNNIVAGYLVTEQYIYYYTNKNETKGLYLISKKNNKETKLSSDNIYQMASDSKNIYLITSATTYKSIVRYALDGKNKKILSGTQLTSNLIVGENNIYYANRSDNGKIYSISKGKENISKLTDKIAISYVDEEKNYTSNNTILELNNKIYYIDKSSNKLFELDLKTMKEKKIEENVSSVVKYSDKQICYTKPGYIGIYVYDTQSESSEKITSVRMTEFIPIDK